MNVEEMLYECCRLRGNPKELIHRTIHELNWFCQNLIFDNDKIINDKYFPLKDEGVIRKIKNFRYEEDFIYKLVSLFYEYCKLIYENNESLKEELRSISTFMEDNVKKSEEFSE